MPEREQEGPGSDRILPVCDVAAVVGAGSVRLRIADESAPFRYRGGIDGVQRQLQIRKSYMPAVDLPCQQHGFVAGVAIGGQKIGAGKITAVEQGDPARTGIQEQVALCGQPCFVRQQGSIGAGLQPGGESGHERRRPEAGKYP